MNRSWKKTVLVAAIYIIIGLVATKVAMLYRETTGKLVAIRLIRTAARLSEAFRDPMPSFYPSDLLFGAMCSGALWLLVKVKGKLIATIRSREISACLVLQAKSQLKSIYKDKADTISGNCDSTLFLGGNEGTTLKELSERLGKETIDLFNTGESRGREISHSRNEQKTGKDLMSQDEIAVMDGEKCILQIRGVRPFLSDKYDITKHPMYKYTADYDEKNRFDIEKFLSRKLRLKAEEEFEVYQVEI